MDEVHDPVLLKEVVEWLQPQEGGCFVDCTVGLGGHAEAMLAASPATKVIGIDCDLDALAAARERLSIFESRVRLVHANFDEVASILARLGETATRGILADLGVSWLQLQRG